jgi:hypothetical protein
MLLHIVLTYIIIINNQISFRVLANFLRVKLQLESDNLELLVSDVIARQEILNTQNSFDLQSPVRI